jgi:glycosyltransferase involved in cell wall biosynthesis
MARLPKISVCVPTYNRGRYLSEALDSILGQSLQDIEIIISDDASTDDTPAIVAQVRDERLRYVRQARNMGIAENRNRCLAMARGQYITWLDSDDIYHPEMLAVQSAVLDRHPNVGLVHGAFEVIDSEGRRLPDWPLPFARDVIEPGKAAFRELVLSNYVNGATVMVRRDCQERVGPYAAGLGKSSEDWEMWLRIALHADLAYTAAPLAQYRQHSGSSSVAARHSGERLRCDIRAVRRLFRRQWALIPDAATVQRQAAAALAAKALIYADDAYTLGKRLTALAAALHGLRLFPGLLGSQHGWLLLRSILCGEEYVRYQHSKAMLGQLYSHLSGTRYGERIRKLALFNPEWEQVLQAIARTIQRVVPQNASILTVDKYDPTLLHLSGRKGWHFPDRRLLPNGYPRSSEVAIQHLEQLRARGAAYLVFPSAAFWWLDYYTELRQHLEFSAQHMWSDEQCIIYHLDAA